MANDATDQQEPPPYRPPSGALVVPAVAVFISHSTPPSSAASSSTSRHRSHSIATAPPRRRSSRTYTQAALAMSAPPSSPPPYSLTPPEVHPIGPTKRASSSPHLHRAADPRPVSSLASHSRQVFSEYSRSPPRINPTSDEDESGAETDDGVLFRSQGRSFADTLRHRLLGKGKGRACDEHWTRPITTTPGALCAGETETEGEDSVSTSVHAVMLSGRTTLQPRNLPTARIRPSSLSQQLSLPASTAWLVQSLFQLFRLLSIVPAIFGTLWNIYHIYAPPYGDDALRVDYVVCALWVCSFAALRGLTH